MLTCMICGIEHPTMISPSHLKTHGITGQEYKQKYPGAKLRVQSAETRAKMAATKSGKTPWNKGISTGPNKKLSDSIKGKPRPELRGKKRSDEQRKNISEKTKLAMVGAMNDDVRKKLSTVIAEKKALGTYVPPMLGKNVSEETKNKIRHSLRATNGIKSRQKIEEFIAVAKDQGIDTETVENNYWFNLHCQQCDTRFTTSRQAFRPSTRSGLELCPTCYPRNSGRSEMEKELYDFIKSLDTSAEPNNRTVLGGKELDIYLPEKNIAFEFTGLYWHSEKQNPENKHLLWKTQFAHKQGVDVYTIFEDEWTQKREIVESRVRGILGLHDKTVFARKCMIAAVTPKTKNEFLSVNHMQGKDACSVALGLFYNDELVSIATFKKSNMAKGGDGSAWELSRFCSKLNMLVPGGGSRLISYFSKNFNKEQLSLISYADRRWSTGKLYESLGFTFAGVSSPSYWYTSDYKTRTHRSALMKHRLVESENDATLTEWQLAQRKGYDRIWDCGTTKWVLN